MMGRLAEALLNLSRRERLLLAVLAAIGLPVAVVFGLILPLADAQSRARGEASEALEIRNWVAARAAEAPSPVGPATAAGEAQEPIGISLLDGSLREAGLRDAVDTLANRGEGEVELGFGNVRFSALASWLDRMAPGWGYEIATLRFDRGEAGDVVAARLVLRPSQ